MFLKLLSPENFEMKCNATKTNMLYILKIIDNKNTEYKIENRTSIIAEKGV